MNLVVKVDIMDNMTMVDSKYTVTIIVAKIGLNSNRLNATELALISPNCN